MANAASLVRASRRASKQTQLALAAKAQVYQSAISRIENGRHADFETIDRLIRATGNHLAVAPTPTDIAVIAATSIAAQLARGDNDRALRALIQLNDALNDEHGLRRALIALLEPATTGHPVWDAAIASLVEWRLNAEHIPSPEWVTQPARSLSKPKFLRVHAADPVPPTSVVPSEFLVRNVLVWPETFASV